MIDLLSLRAKKDEVMVLLKDYEAFCLGKKQLTPEQFYEINRELCLCAALNIGRNRIERREDGSHLIWIAPDKSVHDLGTLENIDPRNYPGFHRGRSLSLAQDSVASHELIEVPEAKRHTTMVRMKDGSAGYGPNYKQALRNAALKMSLKSQFDWANPKNLWSMFYGSA